jgi:hypothetical protein
MWPGSRKQLLVGGPDQVEQGQLAIACVDFVVPLHVHQDWCVQPLRSVNNCGGRRKDAGIPVGND